MLLRQLRKNSLRTGAEPMNAMSLIELDRNFACQLRNLARARSSDGVHLKKAFLAMQEAKSPCEIGPISGGHPRDSNLIPRYFHKRPKRKHKNLTLKLIDPDLED